jgi:hypothetical protein
VTPEITRRAKEWFHRVQTAKLDRSQLSPQANAAFGDDLVKRIAENLKPLGNPTSFTYVDKRVVLDVTAYVYKLTFPSGTFYYYFALNGDGQVDGLRLTPDAP